MSDAATAGAGVTLSTQDWLDVARATLIREGVGSVRVDRLAKACGVTRGGFYWRFKDRNDLLDQLLDDWKQTNTTPLLEILNGPGSPPERFNAMMRLWMEEKNYRPDYDLAVRNWAVTCPKVSKLVHEVDDIRIEALCKLFLEAGYQKDEAAVRARITYFHQVGYYAMGFKESDVRRAELSSYYFEILTGFGSDNFQPPLAQAAG